MYKNLYTASVEAAKKYLFFRPLVEGDPDIRFVGKYKSYYHEDGTASSLRFAINPCAMPINWSIISLRCAVVSCLVSGVMLAAH